MPAPKDSPEARLRSLNEDFLNDMDEDPKGHGVVKPGDESSPDEDDEEIGDTDSEDSEEESDEEGGERDDLVLEEDEESETEEESDDEDSLDDLLLTDDEREARAKSRNADDDSDDDGFLTDEEKLILQEFDELKSDPKLGKHVDRLSTRLKGIAARENEVVNVLRELGTDIRSLGLTPDDLNDRNWTQKVVARIREQTLRELQAAGISPPKKSQQTTTTPQNDEIQLDDDDIVTGAEVKQLLQKELSRRLAPVDQIINERTTTQQKTLFDDVFDHHWKSNPLLRELSKNKEQGVKLKERAKASFGNNYAALLGKDGSGMTIKSNLDEFADLLRHGIRSARSSSSGDGDAKKGRGPITRKGGNAPSRKITKLPAATEKRNGRVFKRSPDDRLAEFNDSFNDELGYGG